MRISDLFNENRKKPVLSFEIFPPKLDIPIESIYEKLDSFAKMKPDYISVTYGAGGSKKDRTIEIASTIVEKYKIESLAHFTCVGQSKEQVDSLLLKMKSMKLDNILALRGDPPANVENFDYNNNYFSHASDLIKYINQKDGFCIGAAAYPEGHLASPKIKYDMHYLKQKVNAGTDFLVTQLFFDNRVFYDFMDRCAAINIDCPITPGIMPIFSSSQILRMAELCGASMPAKVVLMINKYQDNPEDLTKAGLEYAANQIQDLIKNGVAGIHIYTSNRPKSTMKILEYSGLR